MTDHKDLIAEAREHALTVGPNMGIVAADGVLGTPLGEVLRAETELTQCLADALESVLAERDAAEANVDRLIAEAKHYMAEFEREVTPDPLTVEAVADEVIRRYSSFDRLSALGIAQAIVCAFGSLVANREALSDALMSIYDHGTQPNAFREADALLSSGAVEDRATVQAEVINWIDDNYSLSPGNDDALDRAREHFGLEKR